MRFLVALLAATGLLVPAVVTAGPAGAAGAPDADNASAANPYGWFEAGLEWRGDFGDPTVVRSGDTFYAYSSLAAGRHLPVVTSHDLIHWAAHPRWSTSPAPWAGGPNPETDPAIPAEIRASDLSAGDTWNLNDALVAPPAWALPHQQGPWLRADYWAPGVIQMGSTWFAYSAVKVSNQSDDPNGYGRFCITVATAPSPLGPFRDASGSAPIVCDVDPAGSIDPEPFRDPATGETYLLWKATGRRTVPGVPGYPSALKAQRIGADGRPLAGSQPVTLLTTNEGSWEGMTIENPSMAFFNGRYYLFYSGNQWQARADGSSSYATGYAICPAGPRAACTRAANNPLLASYGELQGPGGASAFLDGGGGLRLAFAAFRLGENRTDDGNPHPRRLHITQLVPRSDGSLVVGSAPSVPARSIDRACPPGTGSGTPFSDVPASLPSARAIACVAAWGVAKGGADGRYDPSGTVTRGQLASFLVRLIDASDAVLPAAGADRFGDDDGTAHETNTNRLAAAGLVSGVAPGRFAPAQPVTRGQMATFVRRAVEYVLGRALPAGADVFADDAGSVHEPATNAVAAAGIASGVVPGAFSPNSVCSRAQMAMFLARTLDLAVESGRASAP